ncbi:MAG: ribonuclease P protein component [Brachymonas sp.]|nr:ribonuclease P protein component [Brachymonas sp.]
MRLAHAHWLPLRNAQQFAAVMQQGRVVARTRHFVLHALRWPDVVAALAMQSPSPPAEAESADTGLGTRSLVFPAARGCYLGAVIPKRWARRAVTRNLVKRQIRHVVPPGIPALQGNLAVVVRQRAAFDAQQFVSASSPALRAAVRQELQELVQVPDWPTLPLLLQPPRKPAKVAPACRTVASNPSGTMQPAP